MALVETLLDILCVDAAAAVVDKNSSEAELERVEGGGGCSMCKRFFGGP